MWNIIKHFRTITKHRHMVIIHAARSGIFFQGLRHDLSKYNPEEFFVGAKHYQGNRSPNEGEREDYGYSLAWMHHKGRNKHHYEYWTDYSKVTHKMEPVQMPRKYVVEMFCDRVAASKVYMGKNYNDQYPLTYLHRGRAMEFMHPETAKQIEALLTYLSKNGEKKTFKYIRKEFLKKNKRSKVKC